MKHSERIQKMSLPLKAALLSGKNVWQTRDDAANGIPSLFLADGPHGVRKQAQGGDHLGIHASLPATCFPTAATVANSWDEELAEQVGQALGEEAQALGVQVLLGPGLNMKRSPLCGRNFEYFSEDPYLSGKLAAAYIRGIQSQNVAACPKHFAVNSQEHRRMANNALIDERSLRELYLTAFEIAVKEGRPGSLMTSYNMVNGIYANEHPHLLQDILRDEWGFDGFVVSDWGGCNSVEEAVRAGSDLVMPSPGAAAPMTLVRAVREGRLSEELIDRCVDHMLEAVERYAPKKNVLSETAQPSFDEDAHHALAKKAAAESTVLLKNEEGLLPLGTDTKVALIGDFAFAPRFQGSGSSIVNPTRVETLETVMKRQWPGLVGAARGYLRDGVAASGDTAGKAQVSHKSAAKAQALKEEALQLARQAEVIVYCFGLDENSESEGLDRSHLRLPAAQIELLEALAATGRPIVGILSGGSPIELPWLGYCQSLLHSYLSGQAGAEAMYELLCGRVNPSGRLNESYPLQLSDTPTAADYPVLTRDALYKEGLYVGYRYYQSAAVEVGFPFGYGLSYTEFSYEDIQVDRQGVSFTLTNSGDRDGAIVVQLYIGKAQSRFYRPRRELKRFTKVYLRAGESRRIKLDFDVYSFRIWNTAAHCFEQEGGEYIIEIADNARDVCLTTTLTLGDGISTDPVRREGAEAYRHVRLNQLSNEQFLKLLSEEQQPGAIIQLEQTLTARGQRSLHRNDPLCALRYAKSVWGRLAYRILAKKLKKTQQAAKPDLNIMFVYHMPFRAIAHMSGGLADEALVDGLLQLVNGSFRRGLSAIWRAYRRNKREGQRFLRLLQERSQSNGR